jgi:hypothetical protein
MEYETRITTAILWLLALAALWALAHWEQIAELIFGG